MASDLFVTACDMRKNSSYKTQENKRLSPWKRKRKKGFTVHETLAEVLGQLPRIDHF
jgi:hypothetical protein